MSDDGAARTPTRLTRRDFVKWVAVGSAAVGGGLAAGVGGSVAFRHLGASRRMAEWNRQRPEGPWTWLTEEEALLLEILANEIIPGTDDGPSATQAGVVEGLDRRFSDSPDRGEWTGRTLIAFDRLAGSLYGRGLVDLSRARRQQVVARAQELHEAKLLDSGLLEESEQKIGVVLNMVQGVEVAADEFQRFVRLVREEFYASPAAWEWLGYEGPPFPRGHPDYGTRCVGPETTGNA